jgi:hypothetical protein
MLQATLVHSMCRLLGIGSPKPSSPQQRAGRTP